VLREMQPESGGYLEATPLTSFVVMSLAAAGETEHPVVAAGVRFLLASIRRDGSWPIDTNLATWVTTLAVGALATYKSVMGSGVIFPDRLAIREWLLRQQSTRQHPFTHAAPGAWAWTPLSGGVPDADDTAGALLALRALAEPDERTVASAAAGVRWLVGLQNRDGGIPTFCRGWGALPFDRSTPELTAHALRAWDAWDAALEPSLRRSVRRAASRALRYLERAQRPDGSWVPLWFGSETAPDEENPVYGTARVLLALGSGTASVRDASPIHRRRAVRWLLGVQNDDGGWGGDRAVPSSIEETGVVLSALARLRDPQDARDCETAMSRAVAWLVAATGDRRLEASPIGLYFARLWYYEEMYPLVFAIEGLGSALARHEERAAVASASGRSAS
jgi:squalene-hopene/tetraprenyl-beta-curcumene cyclase